MEAARIEHRAKAIELSRLTPRIKKLIRMVTTDSLPEHLRSCEFHPVLKNQSQSSLRNLRPIRGLCIIDEVLSLYRAFDSRCQKQGTTASPADRP